MKKFISLLKNHGWLGHLAATVINFIWTYYGLTIAAFLTIIFSASETALLYVQEPEFWVPAVIFVFILWTVIGLMTLKNIGETKTVRLAHDYAYSFICEGFMVNLSSSDETKDVDFKTANNIIVTCILRNVGAGPSSVKIEVMDLRLDGRVPKKDFTPIDVGFAKLSQKGIRSAAIERDLTKKILSGTIKVVGVYGPPNSDAVRQFTITSKLNVHVGDKTIEIDNYGIEEKDEVYIPSDKK